MNSVQPQTMPTIKPGDIIEVYSAHESAWGKPAQTYCVRRVETDGTPVSDMDFHHSLSNVVGISRKEGNEYSCIWKKENYEVEPWGHAYLQALADEMPEETKESIADCFHEFNKAWDDFCKKNEKALASLLAVPLVLGVAKMVGNAVRGVGR